ncbi:hypothetical protein [uncultured Acetobacteroides sp.]|uniref:carboxypeptidase-like regulatory domain-containing protein n=1 Tax=uncultured Acetobacteroides sp. TaxID=1760811 RepID=UPI0029F5B23F|nr:hypothetical protein [uncultured Acetobacteroides sp.]
MKRNMKPLQETTKNGIETKCSIVINSAEAAKLADTTLIAENILKDIDRRAAINMRIAQIRKELEEKRRANKAYMDQLGTLAFEGNLMLHSIKLEDEANQKSLRIKTRLNRLKDAKLLEESEIINADLQKQRTTLLGYGYTEDRIDMLDVALARISSIRRELSATNFTYAEIRAQKSEMEMGIQARLKQLNRKIEVNKLLMPKLFHDYFDVKLFTSKKQQSSISGTVLYEGLPLANASIKLYSTRVVKVRKNASVKSLNTQTAQQEMLVYDKLSNSNGEINIRDIKSGTYRIVVEKIGFKACVLTVYVNPKEISMVMVEIERL